MIINKFLSVGELKIPYTSLVELVANAQVHRSLNWKAPIRIFIFDNRVEIYSPGTLPNGLSVDDIVAETSMPRNNFFLQILSIYFHIQELAVAYSVL